MSEPLLHLRQRPIPSRDSARIRKRGYRDIAIDHAGAAAREVLTSIGFLNIAGRNHYAHALNPPYWRKAAGAIEDLFLRDGVAQRLARVDSRLRAEGAALFVLDAWRPRAVQAFFHDEWIPAALRARAPHLSAEEIAAETERYWAAPTDNPDRPAPHETGAAVDVTIMLADGAPLFMGSVFDDPSEVSASDYFEGAGRMSALSFSAEEARANRRLLYWAMEEQGFASHPDEWWHYSYGDQMWAALTGAPAALYGLAAPA